ncbi:Ubiquitin [Phytophthora palmivora]|uniref:Ubiquitin n=1 Tax=Phytophthora palmivora TaxID=4796 RepID=A0A2P4XNP4_9STRA|nr:Ubiquitin [Phytophthora palmivora]
MFVKSSIKDLPKEANIVDIIKVLRVKFQSSHIIECILWCRVELPRNRRVNSIIPEFIGSSLRLIAWTKFDQSLRKL